MCKFLWLKESGKVLGGEAICSQRALMHQTQEVPKLNISKGWESMRGQKDHICLHHSCLPLGAYLWPRMGVE